MHEFEEVENLNPHDDARGAGGAGRLPSELQSFEAALGQLRPSPAAIDRDQLMFLAGQASVRRETLTRAPRCLVGLVLAGLFGRDDGRGGGIAFYAGDACARRERANGA